MGQVASDYYIQSTSEYSDEGFRIASVGYRKDHEGRGNKVHFYSDTGEQREQFWGKRWSFVEGVKTGLIQNEKCLKCEGYDDICDIFFCEIEDRNIENDLWRAYLRVNSSRGKDVLKVFFESKEIALSSDIIQTADRCIPSNPNITRFKELIKNRPFYQAVYETIDGTYDVGFVAAYENSNLGGSITQMALYFALKKLGYSVLLIERPYNSLIGPDQSNAFDASFPYLDYEKARIYPSTDEMRELNDKCKVFVIGSDQFMNTFLYHATSEVFSLKWVYDSKPKLAYATSFGFDFIWDKPEQLKRRKYYLTRFDKFSVREQSSVELMKRNFNIEVDVTVDPVFICDIENYIGVIEKSKINVPSKYICCYILNPSLEKEAIIREVAESLNMEYIIISDAECNDKKYYKNWSLHVDCSVDLKDWLKYIYNATFVVTDSFHGTCFSVIFKKDFITITNSSRGKIRFKFFEELGMSSRIIYDLFDKTVLNQSVDYGPVYDKLDKLISESKQYLSDNLDELMHKNADMTIYDKLLESNNLCRTYNGINKLGLNVGSSVDDIIARMPNFSELHQVQGKIGEPINGTPVGYGVLEIYKSTDYFIKCIFTQMTMNDRPPQIYQAKILNQKVVSWERYVTNEEYQNLEKRLNQAEKDIEFLIRKYASLI